MILSGMALNTSFLLKKHTVFIPALLLLLVSGTVCGASDYPAPVADAGGEGGASCTGVEISRPEIADAVASLAESLDLRALWDSPERLAELENQLEELVLDGLEPRHYGLAQIQGWRRALAAGELSNRCWTRHVTAYFLAALNDLYFGRVDPEATGLVWYTSHDRETSAATILAELGRSAEVGGIKEAFVRARPALADYRKLREHYRIALHQYPAHWTRVADGPLLRPGQADERVAALRRRLREGGYLEAGDTPESNAGANGHYSAELRDAVVAFQADHSLKEDGLVGPDTLAALNRQPAYRRSQLRANLERLRWFARDLQPTMVLVEIAGARVSFFRDSVRTFQARAQAGLPGRETPTLSSRISHVTMNPTWTVPPTILRNDILPAVREDVGYLAEKRIRVFNRQGEELDPQSVDWRNPGAVTLRQDAGPGAALGRVAIRFANPFAVYLHDTPNQRLFETSSRFYSSGCVRVENAMTLTDLLFEGAAPAVISRVEGLKQSGVTANVHLPTPVPLLMVYWTAVVDPAGELKFRPDVYGRDTRLTTLLDRS